MTKLSIDIIRQDGGTQPRSTVHDDWIADYADDMQSGAVFPPVVVFFDGNEYWLADGFHRVGAAVASGLTDIEADVRQGTQRDAVLFSVSANAQHGHRRTNEDKRRAVDVLLNDPKWSKWSDREIARRCNVSNRFVSNMRHGDTREFPPSQNLDTVNGSQYPRNETVYTHPRTGQPAVMHTANIGQCGGGGFGDLQIDTGQRVDPVVALTAYDDAEVLERAKQILSREGRDVVAKFEEEIANLSNTEVGFGDFEDDEDDDADADEVPVHNHRAQGTGENEWYTPTHYIEAAREVMGGIDLDPASSEIANETVQARRFFTIDDDGLKQRWKGNVWLNPPYAQPWIAMFMEKLTEEVEKGNVKQAIALTHNYTDTKWFRSAGVMADRVCLTAGRIAFLDPQREKGGAHARTGVFLFRSQPQPICRDFQQVRMVPKHKGRRMIPGRMFERGRRGEFLVARLLQSRGWGVVPCYDYSGSDGKKAPRLMFERRALPIPDLDVIKGGKRCWVEVKVKARPDFTRITQTWDHGIPLRLLVSYRWVERESGCPVWLFIVEEKNRIIRYSALSALGDPRIWCGQDMDSHGMAFWPIDNFGYCWDIPEQEFIKLNEAV